MSWDVFFANFPYEIRSLEDVPEDFNPDGLCSRQYYEETVFRLFSDIDENNDRSWMILHGGNYAIEFNAGKGETLDSLMLHVRGDVQALDAVKSICDFTGWRALDTSTGEFIDFAGNPDEGFSRWREYRKRFLPEDGCTGSPSADESEDEK